MNGPIHNNHRAAGQLGFLVDKKKTMNSPYY